MGVSSEERLNRLTGILEWIGVGSGGRVGRSELVAMVMRRWTLTQRAAQDYVSDIVAMSYARIEAGYLSVTEHGARVVRERRIAIMRRSYEEYLATRPADPQTPEQFSPLLAPSPLSEEAQK